ncbi:MAG: C40 family peptidase [Myxococcales bacterium]|nr:C40 family peptidase [Myxococcales bacterium]
MALSRCGWLMLWAFACTPQTAPPEPASPLAPARDRPASPKPPPAPSTCPASKEAPSPLPGVTQAERTAAYWIERAATYGPVDAPLLTPEDADAHDAAFREPALERPYAVYDLEGPVDTAALKGELQERFDWLAERFSQQKYVDGNGNPTSIDAARTQADLALRATSELRVALGQIQVYCAPTTAAFFTPSLDKRFDRNHCSGLSPQEVVQVLVEWPGGMRLVRTRYVYGWIAGDAPLSPPVPAGEAAAWIHGPYGQVTAAGDALPVGTRLPLADGGARVADASGFRTLDAGGLRSTARPLTRRALLEEAFSRLDQPYGWGGVGGGRDCSDYLMDVFGSFGVELPRHSASQAAAGSFSLDLTTIKDEGERLRLIESAAQRGVVLLHFPGHIMLYLGKNADGRPMAIHAFAEYLEPCDRPDPARPETPETLLTVDRIQVSDLELGRGTSRTAFIERITKVTVFGPGPGDALVGTARSRPAARPAHADECKIADGFEIFASPRSPNARQPLRVVVTSVDDPEPGVLELESPSGERLLPPVKRFGLGPYGVVAKLEAPEAGRWTIRYGDGARVSACRRVVVGGGRPKAGSSSGMAWSPRLQWGEDTENFYALFVEALFDYPLDQDVEWTNLHTILKDPERNLLFDHLSAGEEDALNLQPDCADLPYLLRAYFAWKLGLPFAYRPCNRGRAGRPPSCQETQANTMDRPDGKDDVEAFLWFANRKVRSGVHSASGRTHPDDDATDFYPVPMERRWIRPGTLYADPYGHLLIVVDWMPQPLDGYGVLLAADGQPDGTIGRRRFWQGSFLFDPSTDDVGAGFKAFRPVAAAKGGEITTLTNAELADRKGFAPFSRAQYAGTADDFYDRMEDLINPRPLDPMAMQQALVDAFDENVRRRVTSVSNGAQWVKENPRRTVEMPKGYAIFETSGPWEDYSTPSRDLRLLISMDTVLKFAERVRRAPGRFGLTPDRVEPALADLVARRDAALKARSITYEGSDGAQRTLTLQDVLDRAAGFEMSYNPNDCVELRWAAPPGSAEMAACQRRAPAGQQALMAKYRPWFAARKRPPR